MFLGKRKKKLRNPSGEEVPYRTRHQKRSMDKNIYKLTPREFKSWGVVEGVGGKSWFRRTRE